MIIKEKKIFKLTPCFDLEYDTHLYSYFLSMEGLVNELIFSNFEDIEDTISKEFFYKLNQILPIISHSEIKDAPFCLKLNILCSATFNHGLEKFIHDMISKWLIFGKNISINANRSMLFSFDKMHLKKYFAGQYFINIENSKNILLLNKNLPSFLNELKLIILSVQRTRHILSLNHLTKEQKSLILKTNLNHIIDNKNIVNDNYIYQVSKEKKLFELHDNISKLIHKKPLQLDKNIYESFYNQSLIFKNKFSIDKEKHLSRIISFQYIFKQSIQDHLLNGNKNERAIHIKIVNFSSLNTKESILGILVVMNLLHENEYFEKSFILEAISSVIKDFKYVENSYIVDHRDDKLLSFYIEISKKSFTLNEIKELKNRLKNEFQDRMKHVLNPIFLPRNEEEILRNIVVLSKQIQYVKDLPQVIISFNKQTLKEISFIVILLRLVKKDTLSIKDHFSYSKTFLRLSLDESKIVGLLKKKHPKEANIFRVSLNKFNFFRRDYSLDLRKARQEVVKELKNIIGEFRDFNGGMLAKQCESLDHLKSLMPELKKSDEFLLENFFYSIRPGIMQSILDSNVLKTFFSKFLEMFRKTEFEKMKIETFNENKYFYVLILTHFKKVKEDIILNVNKLKYKSFELISSSVELNDIKFLGYILKSDDTKIISKFLKTVQSIEHKKL